MNGGQQNQSGYSSGFYGTSPLQRQNQDMYRDPFSSNNIYSMRQSHSSFGTPIADNSPIKISPDVPDTQVEPYVVRTKTENGTITNSNCITTMDRYSRYSLEELRCADYLKGRKGTIIQRPSYSQYGTPYGQSSSEMMSTNIFQKKPETSSFGSLAQSGFTQRSGTSIFSSPQPQTNAFGQPQSSTFGQPQNTTFGQPQSSSSAFGYNSPFSPSPLSTSNNPSQNTPSSIFSSLGQAPSNNTNTFSHSLLGQSQNTQQPQTSFSSIGVGNNSLATHTQNNQNTQGAVNGTGALGNMSMLNNNNPFSMGNSSMSNQSTFGASNNSFAQPQNSLTAQTPTAFPQATAPSSTSSFGSFGGLGTSAGGQTQSSSLLGTSLAQNAQQTQQNQGSLFGQSMQGTPQQSTGIGSGLFGSENKPADPSPSFSFGMGGTQKSTTGLGFGEGLGGANKSSGFGSSLGFSNTTDSKPLFSSSLGGSSSTGLSAQSSITDTKPAVSDDPYLIKALDFKECEEYKKKTLMEIPVPLFKKAPQTKIKFRAVSSFKEYASGAPVQKIKEEVALREVEENEYYCIPSISQIKKMPSKRITGFIIGRKNHGRIEFQEEVDLSNINLDTLLSMIHIEDSYLFFDYDPEQMRPGTGINKAAKITLENVTPYGYTTGSIKNLTEDDASYSTIKSRVLANLPKGPAIEDAQFDLATGVLVIICTNLWK